MKENEWKAFCKFRTEYKNNCRSYTERLGYEYAEPSSEKCAAQLFSELRAELCRGGITALQKKAQRYLVGLAGKIADNFFKANPALGIDFRKNVIILNKTPIHTAKTKQLSYLLKEDASGGFKALFEASQIFNAQKTAELQRALSCPLWLVGYSELRPKGLFTAYAEEIKKEYGKEKNPPLYLYQHFSMNRFLIDLKENYADPLSLKKNLELLGLRHRKEILGF